MKSNAIWLLSLLLILSCKDAENTDEVEIIPPEEKRAQAISDSLEADTRRGENLYARLQAHPEFNRFREYLDKTSLDDTLRYAGGPFTLFVPDDTAYDRLSPTEELQIDNASIAEHEQLYNYYVVDGEITVDWLGRRIEQNQGSYEITTRSGGVLTATTRGDDIILTDTEGNQAVLGPDELGSNGILYGIDNILDPGEATLGAPVGPPGENEIDAE